MRFLLWSYVALIILAATIIVGWVMNISAILKTTDIHTATFVLRVVGVFLPPLGGFMGWFV